MDPTKCVAGDEVNEIQATDATAGTTDQNLEKTEQTHTEDNDKNKTETDELSEKATQQDKTEVGDNLEDTGKDDESP